MNYPKAQPIESKLPTKRNYVSVPQYKQHQITVGPVQISYSDSPGVGSAVGAIAGIAAVAAGVFIAHEIYKHLSRK